VKQLRPALLAGPLQTVAKEGQKFGDISGTTMGLIQTLKI